jgi:hypothetical protein
MTVTQSFSLSLTYTSLRMYLPQAAPAAVSASSQNSPTAPAGDTVTLSPEATAQQNPEQTPASSQPEGSVSQTLPDAQAPAPPVDAPETPVPSPEAPSAPTSRAARRAEVLLNALDADQDGSVTKEEFIDGAMALLRQAGARHHHRHHRVDDEGGDRSHEGHEGHRVRGLERKLDRLFDRVDDSGDGSIDQAELTDALAKVTREPRPGTTETPDPSAQETPSPAPSPEAPAPSSPSPETSAPATVPHTPPAASMFYTSVTVVIAVKKYTSVAAMNA